MVIAVYVLLIIKETSCIFRYKISFEILDELVKFHQI